MLLFPSLITGLCRWVGADESLKYSWISSKTPIYPLEIHREGALRKRKKRKAVLGRLVKYNVDLYRLSIIGPIDEISVKIKSDQGDSVQYLSGTKKIFHHPSFLCGSVRL